ncbi:MAG: alanine dehydrogenase [Planctomycetes bacterium]|nr:alanine dehydrogenase [Planctomycetota bacterium]
MIIGVPKEIKQDEYRVAMIPVGVEEMREAGHKVLVETKAGEGSGIADAEYRKAGAKIAPSAREVFKKSDMIVKVKEPLPSEYRFLRKGQTVFTYFHFAASCSLTKAVMKSGITAVAYETISLDDGTHPLLTPMSEVAGRMAIQEGAKYLERPMEGRGILLGGVPGVAPAEVVIIGGGIVGTNAAKVAAGLGARVIVLDVNLDRLRYLDDILPKNVITLMSNAENLRAKVAEADLLIGAVLVVGARAPRLVTKEMIKTMKPGAVVVDVAIDQGGCIETSRPTTHRKPTYKVHKVLHYCVTNMPGAVGRTSTYALTNVTLPYALQIANKGWRQAAKDNPAICRGVNVTGGSITYKAVAETFRMKCHDLKL